MTSITPPAFVKALIKKQKQLVIEANEARLNVNPFDMEEIKRLNKKHEQAIKKLHQLYSAQDFILYIWKETELESLLVGGAEIIDGKLLITDKSLIHQEDVNFRWTVHEDPLEVEVLKDLTVEEVQPLTVKEFFEQCPSLFGPGKDANYCNHVDGPQVNGFHLKTETFKAIKFTTIVNVFEFEDRKTLTLEGLVQKTNWTF